MDFTKELEKLQLNVGAIILYTLLFILLVFHIPKIHCAVENVNERMCELIKNSSKL